MLKKIFALFIISNLLSCGLTRSYRSKYQPVKKHTTTKPKAYTPKVKASTKIPKHRLTKEEKIEAYINRFGAIAQEEMRRYKIPASITLAQGIVESGAGYSRLAREGNNHFGIKCHRGWNGGKIYHDDDAKGECFRTYKDPKESYRDHSIFLSGKQRYAFLFDIHKSNYKKWAKGLKKAGYATDPKYPEKLVAVIEEYKLYRFDSKEAKNIKPVSISNKKPTKLNENKKVHRVNKGDTLYSISRRYNISVEQLKRKNKLNNNNISIGQELVIPKS